MWLRFFVWNFNDTPLNSTQNILPIHWKMCVLFTGENLRAFMSSEALLKRPRLTLGESRRILSRPHFYQTRSAWSMDQGSTKKRSAVHNFVPTVTKFCVIWEGLSLPHDTKFGNCRGETVDRRVIFIWSLIHGSSWSGLIKVGPDVAFWSDSHTEVTP